MKTWWHGLALRNKLQIPTQLALLAEGSDAALQQAVQAAQEMEQLAAA